ncbi:MAG: N-acetylmuramic acid 6-phosphate etherase [Caldilineales bacterium]
MTETDRSLPVTEARNAATASIDTLATLDMVRIINAEDSTVPAAVALELERIAAAIDAIAARMAQGGRLIYIGAGTSGRLAMLDASECPPTFGTSPEQVVALLAGGERAIRYAVEGAEDDQDAGARDVAVQEATLLDSIVGVAASGRTPYVLGGMAEARRRGSLVISLACHHPSPMADMADMWIAPITGPEVLTGSTRLKAGTAQKLVLNMLSTGVMIRLGKTYGNLMVDVQASNVKLRDRARRIVELACDLSPEAAEATLLTCDREVKTAIVAQLGDFSPAEARERLDRARGAVRAALEAE